MPFLFYLCNTLICNETDNITLQIQHIVVNQRNIATFCIGKCVRITVGVVREVKLRIAIGFLNYASTTNLYFNYTRSAPILQVFCGQTSFRRGAALSPTPASMKFSPGGAATPWLFQRNCFFDKNFLDI